MKVLIHTTEVLVICREADCCLFPLEIFGISPSVARVTKLVNTFIINQHHDYGVSPFNPKLCYTIKKTPST